MTMDMEMDRPALPTVLEAMLDAWDRNNTVLVNLLRAIPAGGLNARAMAGSPTVAQMFAHLIHERLVSVFENAPEWGLDMEIEEWAPSSNAERLAEQLEESALRVRHAVEERTEAGSELDESYSHPIQLLPFLIFHEGYHHGQIKLALKAAGCPISDDVAGPLTWDVWRAR